jgi:ribosomal-protein-alanine N-acetyltransferase
MKDTSEIETARIRVVPFAEGHLSERYVGWLGDPEVVRYSDQRYRTHTLASCRDYWKSFDGSANYFWAMVAKDPALGHFGNMNAYVDERHGVVDVGILVGERSVWGKGYGTEAWVGVLDFLLRTRGFRKVTAGTLSVNHGMRKIMERSGMEPDGVRSGQYVFEGAAVDVVHAAAFRDRWRRPGR